MIHLISIARLILDCFKATVAPKIAEVKQASVNKTRPEGPLIPASITFVDTSRAKTTKAASFVEADIKVVMGEGAPWYASGDQKWKGKAATLKSKPTLSNTIETFASEEFSATPTKAVEPVNP